MKNYVLITGASSGIGLELAKVFARENHNLILTARSEKKLSELQQEIQKQYNVDVIVIPKDLSLDNSASEIYDEIKKRKQNVDILVNNAGFGTYGNFTETNLETEIRMINLNITSLVKLTKFFSKEMLERRSGKIMNVASTAAFQAGPLMSIYYATKAFVLSFSEAIANELKGSGVTVTILCPGPTTSGFQEAANITQSRIVKGRKLPTSADVAEYGYKALMKGKRIAIHGTINSIMANSIRFFPRKFVTAVVGFIQKERDQKNPNT
ncbi:MAG: SDR family oxidoreductase [Ignavibacteriales bacterium]